MRHALLVFNGVPATQILFSFGRLLVILPPPQQVGVDCALYYARVTSCVSHGAVPHLLPSTGWVSVYLDTISSALSLEGLPRPQILLQLPTGLERCLPVLRVLPLRSSPLEPRVGLP